MIKFSFFFAVSSSCFLALRAKVSSCSQQRGDGALHIAITIMSNSHTGRVTLRAPMHRYACICIGCFQRHAFRKHTAYTYTWAMTRTKKRYNGTQIPRLKVPLFAAKCSLQAVNSHKHSSNLSTSPDFMLFFAVFKARGTEETLPCETWRQTSGDFLKHIRTDPITAVVALSPAISHAVW